MQRTAIELKSFGSADLHLVIGASFMQWWSENMRESWGVSLKRV